MSRIATIFRAMFNALLGRAESARYGEILDLSYEDLTTELVKVRQALAQVGTSKYSIDRQITEANETIAKLASEATEVFDGTPEGEALAARILTRKAEIETELGTMITEFRSVNQSTEELKEQERDLQAAIDRFGRRKETMKGKHAAAKADVHAREIIGGIAGKFGDAGRTIGRMEAETARLQDRSKSLAEMTASGNLPDFTLPQGTSHLDREIAESKESRSVQADLAALREGKTLQISQKPKVTEKVARR